MRLLFRTSRVLLPSAIAIAMLGFACGRELRADDTQSATDASDDGRGEDADPSDAASADAPASLDAPDAPPCVLCPSADAPGPCAIACEQGDITALAVSKDARVLWAGAPTITVAGADGGVAATIAGQVGVTRLITATGFAYWTRASEPATVHYTNMATLVTAATTVPNGSLFGLATRADEAFAARQLGATTLVSPLSGPGEVSETVANDVGVALAAFPGAGGDRLYVAYQSGRISELAQDGGVVRASDAGAELGHLALTNAGLFYSTTVAPNPTTTIHHYTQAQKTEDFATLNGTVRGLASDANALYAIGMLDQASVVSITTTPASSVITTLAPPYAGLRAGPIATSDATPFVFFALKEASGWSRVMRVRKP